MTIAFILKGYPRLSETFIAQEILGLEQRGLDIEIISLRQPYDALTHPIHKQIKAPIFYLPEYIHKDLPLVFKSFWGLRKTPTFKKAFQLFWADFKRDITRNRIRRFAQSLVLANHIKQSQKNITHLHFHFLHTPASVARYTAVLCALPYSGSAHARDIWTSPKWDLQEKLESLEWVSTCTAYGASYLKSLTPSTHKVLLAYHGIDLERFAPPHKIFSLANGHGAPVQLLSVGRGVEKKGYDTLIEALLLLPPPLKWTFTHIGGGEKIPELKRLAKEKGLKDRMTWLGKQEQSRVKAEMEKADIFVLASQIASDGDRDGLPNVLMEAQSQLLTVVSTDISAIPELIIPNKTGLLVPQQDPKSLAMALEQVITNPNLRQELAQAGLERLQQNFEAHLCLNDIAHKFGLT